MIPAAEDTARPGLVLYLDEHKDYPTRRTTLEDIKGNNRCIYNKDNNLNPSVYVHGFNGALDEHLNGVDSSFFGWVCNQFAVF